MAIPPVTGFCREPDFEMGLPLKRGKQVAIHGVNICLEGGRGGLTVFGKKCVAAMGSTRPSRLSRNCSSGTRRSGAIFVFWVSSLDLWDGDGLRLARSWTHFRP